VPVGVLAAAVALGAAGVSLVVISWRRRSVLALLCGALGTTAAIDAAAARSAGRAAGALCGALLAITIGAVLLAIGQAVERLLDEEPGESA
jgi:hypothetical protein